MCYVYVCAAQIFAINENVKNRYSTHKTKYIDCDSGDVKFIEPNETGKVNTPYDYNVLL